jgi:subtilisin family serine protease
MPVSIRIGFVTRPFTVVLVMLAVLVAAPPAVAEDPAVDGGAPGRATAVDQDHAPDVVLAKLRAKKTLPEALGSAEHIFGPWYRVSVPLGDTAAEHLGRVAALPEVELAELNLVGELAAIPVPPNDPLYPAQWHLPGVQAPEAWSLGTGAGVTVAVLDTGVSQGGVDLDCHSLVHPYDALSQTAGLAAAADANGHGTHVAGTIAQCTDNGAVGAGVAPDADLMPVKVVSTPEFGDEGTVTAAHLADGIVWAIDHGADVLNMSLGFTCIGSEVWPDCSSSIVDDAIVSAVSAGAVLVASAGNDGGSLAYPANHPDVVAVGALDRNLDRAVYSSTGGMLAVMAPGGDLDQGAADGVWQETFIGDEDDMIWGAYSFEGTSMAAPHVAGAAAVLWSAVPGATSDQVRQAMLCTGLDKGPTGFDTENGFGALQIRTAAEALLSGAPADTELCKSVASVGLVDPGAGLWSLRGAAGGSVSFYYGNPGDFPIIGDWDCDGDETPGMYRRSDGFVYLRNSNTQGVADIKFFFGNPGDIPIVGDFNGNGCDTVSIYRPSLSKVFIINVLGENNGGLGAAELEYFFGNPGDKPFVGDFDGDGTATIGLHRESTGLVYFRNTHTQGVADNQFIFGDPGDRLVAGDWVASGVDSPAVFRPSNTTFYFRHSNTQGNADNQFDWGEGPFLPVAGNFGLNS